ncbi:transposase [Streptomyces sp. NPDC058874]|uniref:transposase n=1 Tax=unclassified Streptomyces TaxID=2593676 RepID=UPI0036B2DE00
MGLVEHSVKRDALSKLSEFRSELYECLTSRADALFDLCDALLCTDGPVRTLVDLALAPEHRRGHSALYSGINAQLRLARPLTRDLRRPWERPAEPNRLTPARVRRGFRNLHAKTVTPARAPKPTSPGPGRPPGSKNRRPVPHDDVGLVLATGESYTRPAHHKVGTKPRRTGRSASSD